MAISEKSLANLKPRKKGDKGQLGGGNTGKVYTHSKKRLKTLLATVVKGKDMDGNVVEMTIAEAMDMAMVIRARKGDVRAYEAILNRAEGKIEGATPIADEGETTINVHFIEPPATTTDAD